MTEQEGPTEGIEIDLELLSTKELAYYITTFDWDLFWAVHEYELLYHTFGRHHFGKVSFEILTLNVYFTINKEFIEIIVKGNNKVYNSHNN